MNHKLNESRPHSLPKSSDIEKKVGILPLFLHFPPSRGTQIKALSGLKLYYDNVPLVFNCNPRCIFDTMTLLALQRNKVRKIIRNRAKVGVVHVSLGIPAVARNPN